MSFLDEILKKLGWEDGFQIPIANAENQELEEEVARLTLQRVKGKNAFETSSVKLENLESHLKNVTQESEESQSLITAYSQQLKAEEHGLRVNVAEKEKIEQEVRVFIKKIKDVNERKEVKQIQLQKCSVKLEKLKAETDWDAEALKAWEESLQKRDHDNELIKKFSKEDERKYNELEAKRQNLEVEFANRKQTIDKMFCDLTNYERILERTGKVMKQQVIERDALIQQWKDSVRILHQRDKQIDRLQNHMLEVQDLIQQEQDKLEEQNVFYKNEIKNNEEVEHNNQELNLLNSRIRRELNELSQHILLLTSQAETVRRTLLSTANQLEKERSQRRNIHLEIESKEKKIQKYETRINLLSMKYNTLKKSAMSSDDSSKHFEKLLNAELRRFKAINCEIEATQNVTFRMQQELQKQLNIGKQKEIMMHGITTNINHLRKHNEDSSKTLSKQKEDAYELDYKIDDLQRQILIHENAFYGDDKDVLEAKLAELDGKMAEHTEIKTLLKDQVNKIRDDMRRLTTAISADRNQLTVLKDKLQNQIMTFQGGNKQVEASKIHFQQTQVEENLLRLRVDHLAKSMKKEEKHIYNLQKFRLNLEQATKERLIQIDTNKEILLVKKRNLGEDRGRLRADLSERRIRLDQFQKKYDIVLKSLGKDEDGEPISVTQVKIQNAQEKFFLQKEGDELDQKIKKAEKEIVAMENTLKVVNLTNSAFKQSLGAVEDDGREMNELKKLENEMLKVNDVLRQQRKEFSKKRQQLTDIEAILEELEVKRKRQHEEYENLNEEYIKTVKEKNEKEEKVNRTENCLRTAAKKIRKTVAEKYEVRIGAKKRDLEIRQLIDANKSAMQRLLEFSIRYQETTPLITRYTLENDIKLEGKYSPASSSSVSVITNRSCQDKDFNSVKSSDSSKGSACSKILMTLEI